MQEEQPDANWQYTPENTQSGYAGNEVGQASGVPLPEIPAVTWTASEYIAHEKSTSWFFGLFSGALALVAIIYFVTRDILASVAVLAACIAVSAYAIRKPETKEYQVSEKGVKAGDQTYSYGEFRSFSVVEEGAIDSIWLKPLKRFSAPVVMYCSPEDEQKIVDVLSNFLPHEQRELDAIDRFSKKVRF